MERTFLFWPCRQASSIVQCTIVCFALSFLSSCNAPAAAPHQAESSQAADQPERFGFGHAATPEEIAAWDIDIMPDGTGLPDGSGSVLDGKAIYEQKCSACHGATGTEGPNDRLVGRLPAEPFNMGDDLSQRRHKAIGSYWPYSSTLFDYIRRAMPLPMPGSLTDDEVYALSAYILHLNDLLPEGAVLDAESLPLVSMPAKPLYTPDDRVSFDQVH